MLLMKRDKSSISVVCAVRNSKQFVRITYLLLDFAEENLGQDKIVENGLFDVCT